MADPSLKQASHGDMDHGFGDIEALLVVADQAPSSDHPPEGALDHPAPRQNFEALLPLDPTDDRDDEAEEGGVVHELSPVVGAVGEEMLEPWPA